MKRRGFINSIVTTGCGIGLLSSCVDEIIEPKNSVEEIIDKVARRGTPTLRNRLKIPLVVSPNGLTLQSKPSVVDLGGNAFTKALTYNDSFPGPTIKASAGDTVSVQLQNLLSNETIAHWHGMLVDHMNDGQPHQAISPNGTYNYNYQIIQRAALNWYHPHPHMLTGEQVYMGQAGAFIVNDAEELALGLPSGKYEMPLIIRDATLDSTGNLIYKPRSGGFLGQIPLVNGTKDPYLEVEPTMYRFRILNGANSRIFGLTLTKGKIILIGNDGGLLPNSSIQSQIDLSNGERLDILVDFSGFSSGETIQLKDARSGWVLLEFRVIAKTASTPTYTGPTQISSTIEMLNNPVQTREFSFDGMSKINGKIYDHMRIDFTVPFNQTELWRFKTSGNAPHPVHVHGASFQVISRTGGRGKLFDWEKGWKDTVLLEDQETVEVLIKFHAYKGVYLLHCHKLEHEDMGMMSNFEVV